VRHHRTHFFDRTIDNFSMDEMRIVFLLAILDEGDFGPSDYRSERPSNSTASMTGPAPLGTFLEEVQTFELQITNRSNKDSWIN
jgi:hypothetical protein